MAQGAYKLYDADAMHGLPVGVQVIGQRLQEEKVLAVMKRVEEALVRSAMYTRSVTRRQPGGRESSIDGIRICKNG